MKDFTFQNTTKLVFGKTAMDSIAAELKPFGHKILLTYGKGSIKSSGIYDKVISQLKDFEVQEFAGIEPNPRVATLRKAIELGKSFQPNIILAVGGGSVIDGSKLISAGIYSDIDAWDLVLDSTKINKCVPIATVLTIAATGSEMDAGGVITNWEENRKLAFGHKNVLPVVSFLDPQNLFSVSAIQTAYGIVDIYSHVFEQYMTTSQETHLQERWSEGILQTLIENAPRVMANLHDYDARANIMISSTMALNGLIEMGANEDWATHRIEHELSAFYDIAHGLGLAIITPHWLEVVASKQKLPRLVQYGKRIFNLTGSDDEIATAAIQKTSEFFHSMGITMHLKELNIAEEHFDVIVERLVAAKIGEFPLQAAELREILNKCL
jgi:alcohol dehydrogenase YqhD (iron-dependent ADH family)